MEFKISKSFPGVGVFTKHPVIEYNNQGYLDKFYTNLINHPDYWLSKSLNTLFNINLSRRNFDDIPMDKIRTYPWKELIRIIGAKNLPPNFSDSIWEWAELSFDMWVSKNLRKGLTAIELAEHSSLNTIKRAQKLGIITIYEQPSQHHSFFTPIVKSLLDNFPELVDERSKLQINEKSVRRNKRRDQEIVNADIILCNSRFTKTTLLSSGLITEDKIIVNNLGFPVTQPKPYKTNYDKIIFLNAGTQNVRKGLHNLYNVWKRNFSERKDVELWLIGSMNLPKSLLSGLGSNVVIKDSVPREELLEIYKLVDVFILPTYADGFGMVISEAMSRGVPVITTYNSGGPDIINHREDGLLIPAGDEEALRDQMEWCVENKQKVREMGSAAIKKAERWQWEDSRLNHVKIVIEKINILTDEKKRKGL